MNGKTETEIMNSFIRISCPNTSLHISISMIIGCLTKICKLNLGFLNQKSVHSSKFLGNYLRIEGACGLIITLLSTGQLKKIIPPVLNDVACKKLL